MWLGSTKGVQMCDNRDSEMLRTTDLCWTETVTKLFLKLLSSHVL